MTTSDALMVLETTENINEYVGLATKLKEMGIDIPGNLEELDANTIEENFFRILEVSKDLEAISVKLNNVAFMYLWHAKDYSEAKTDVSTNSDIVE